MRFLLVWCICSAACTRPEPVQNPLDYLRVGVNPRVEADAIVNDLRAHGFEVRTRIDEPDYVAFDASRGADSMVRVVTARGAVLSLQTPDVRFPERLDVALAPGPRPDFDRDGRLDVVVSIRERDRVCLAWAQVTAEGFVSEVFRPQRQWGDSPCAVSLDAERPALLLEVSVPGGPSPQARVKIPIVARNGTWAIDESPEAQAWWDREIDQRRGALQKAEARGDADSAARLSAELGWLRRLRKAEQPVLRPAEDGEEAR